MCHLLHCFRKGIAPHLKSLIGPWWFSQFDPAPEVAQAARRSFEVGARPSLINVTGCNLLLLDYLDLLHPFLTWNARRKILNPLRACFDRQGFTQSLWIGRKVNSFSSWPKGLGSIPTSSGKPSKWLENNSWQLTARNGPLMWNHEFIFMFRSG